MIPQTKDSVMETMAGFFNGKMASLNLKTSTHTVGLSMIKTVADTDPIRMEATAPAVVNFFQTIDKKRAGKFPLAAIAKARPTIKATFCPLKSMPSGDRNDTENYHSNPCYLDLFCFAGLTLPER